MKLTTKDIIKILPFEESYRDDLLQNFDSLGPDAKFNVEQALWVALNTYEELMHKRNTMLALQRVRDGQEDIDKDFYIRIAQKTYKDIEEFERGSKESTDLAEARKAMELIVREMQAAKKYKN